MSTSTKRTPRETHERRLHRKLRQYQKFGVPSEPQVAALRAIADLARLEALAERLLDVNTRDELLAGG